MDSVAIPRVVGQTQTSDFVAMALMLYAVPRLSEKVDALIAMPGMGEDWRVTEAVKVWEEPTVVAQRLLIAGVSDNETTYGAMTLDRLKEPPFNLRRIDGVSSQVQARHTVDQVDWLARQIQELGVESLAVFVSPYHLLRAFCTLLKAMERHSVEWVPMIPAPVTVPPARLIPETQVDSWSSVPGEVSRLETYQAKGDVATYDELRTYLNWLWEQPILASLVAQPVT